MMMVVAVVLLAVVLMMLAKYKEYIGHVTVQTQTNGHKTRLKWSSGYKDDIVKIALTHTKK